MQPTENVMEDGEEIQLFDIGVWSGNGRRSGHRFGFSLTAGQRGCGALFVAL